MAVRGIHHDHVDAGRDQRLDARFGIAADADRGADQQRSPLSLAAFGLSRRLLDVLDRDQAAQLELVVDHQHLLDAVLVHQRQHFVVAGAFAAP